MKKLIATLLSLTIILSLCVPAFAMEKTETDAVEAALASSADPILSQYSSEIAPALESIEKMSASALENYIDQIAAGKAPVVIGGAVVTAQISGKLAWFAAAELAEQLGYPCAAALIECSLMNEPYMETTGKTGLFTAKIRNTSIYQQNLKAAKKQKGKTYISKDFVLTKSMDADLYYSLHIANLKITRGKNAYSVTITDTFDFALWTQNLTSFSTMVNNFGYLNQCAGVLNPIKVTITFKE